MGSMLERILLLYADEQREVFLAEVADPAAPTGHQYDLGDDHGYFICEANPSAPASGYEVLGKVASYDAAVRLHDVFLKLYASARLA